MIVEVVYIEDLTIKSYPRQTFPAVVFEWRFNNPFSETCNMNERVKELTVVQPAAYAPHTVYWKASEYGKTWLPYSQPMFLWRE